jgi:arylsulfatase A-like enzyme
MNTRPNIIVILADDLSYWDISHFGQREFSTPNIDRMAREGMVFTNAYAASPECAPSRAGLLTGRHMGHCTFKRLFTDVRPELHDRPYLLPEDETIAHVLAASEYTACQIGKWHAGEPGTPGMPNLQGFERSLAFDHGNNTQDKRAQYVYPTRLWRNGVLEHVPENEGFEIDHPDHRFDEEGRLVPGGIADPAKARYCEDIYMEEALDFLRSPHEKPFFLYYASSLTHAEWPKELRELKDKPAPWGLDQKRWAGQVTHMDRSVGVLLDELKSQGLDENTLVIFTSDNGYAAWCYDQREPWEDDPVLKNKGPWDRGKLIAANGGVIVPFIAWCPGSVAVGETHRAVSAYDLKATFAALAGANMENETDGVSFAPLFSGSEDQVARRHFLYWEQGLMGENVQSALLDEQYFALRMQPDHPTELFDIFDDPGCKKNLADERQPWIERAETLFTEQHGESPWYPNLTLALKKMESVDVG